MNQRFVLAYDLGTSGVKCALVTLSGRVVAGETVFYPLHMPQPGWVEQDPEDYWRGVCDATKAVMSKSNVEPKSIAGIAFSTMWRGIIPIDQAGNVLHNSIIWLDSRAVDQAKRMQEHFPDKGITTLSYWPKLMWLRENRPDVIEDAAVILEANSFLKWKATGVAAVDISNCYTRSFDPELESLYRAFLEVIDIPQDKFPPCVRSDELVGYMTKKAAEEMGLVPGIPVFGGCNDMKAVAVGTGSANIGGVHIDFGSSGWVGYTIPHTPNCDLSPFDTERDVITKGVQAIGLSFNWTVQKFYSAEFEQMGEKVFAFVDKEVEQTPPGADGVLATPWFYGEYPPLCGATARGNFLNLGPRHDRRYLTRAIMEGVCYHLKMQNQTFDIPWPEAINVIGGATQSDVWMQMLADIMETPVRVIKDARYAATVGAAYCALIGLGVCFDYNETAQRVQVEKIFYPQKETKGIYRRNFAVFQQLHTILEPMFRQMNENTEEVLI